MPDNDIPDSDPPDKAAQPEVLKVLVVEDEPVALEARSRA